MKYIPLVVFFLLGCSSSQELTYRPKVSSDPLWQLSLYRPAMTDTYQLVRNDSVICSASFAMQSTSAKGESNYRGHDVVIDATRTYTRTHRITTWSYLVLITIDGELVYKFAEDR
jgi:hypothetical protein